MLPSVLPSVPSTPSAPGLALGALPGAAVAWRQASQHSSICPTVHPPDNNAVLLSSHLFSTPQVTVVDASAEYEPMPGEQGLAADIQSEEEREWQRLRQQQQQQEAQHAARQEASGSA